MQIISDVIFILSSGSCPRGETLGRWDIQGVKENSNMAYQTDGDDEQNRMQAKGSSLDANPRVRGWGGLQAKYL